MTHPTQHDDLKAAAERATPGPWYCETGDDSHWFALVNEAERDLTIHYKYCAGRSSAVRDQIYANAAYIAAANPARILAMIAEIDTLRAERTTVLQGCNALTELLKQERDHANYQRDEANARAEAAERRGA
jgi:hypothetical protein